jgi:hypothetical protein
MRCWKCGVITQGTRPFCTICGAPQNRLLGWIAYAAMAAAIVVLWLGLGALNKFGTFVGGAVGAADWLRLRHSVTAAAASLKQDVSDGLAHPKDLAADTAALLPRSAASTTRTASAAGEKAGPRNVLEFGPSVPEAGPVAPIARDVAMTVATTGTARMDPDALASGATKLAADSIEVANYLWMRAIAPAQDVVLPVLRTGRAADSANSGAPANTPSPTSAESQRNAAVSALEMTAPPVSLTTALQPFALPATADARSADSHLYILRQHRQRPAVTAPATPALAAPCCAGTPG